MSKFEIAPLVRKDKNGKVTFMCRSGGYVMVRHPRAMPFVLSEKEWRKLQPWSDEASNDGQSTSQASDT